MSVRSTIETARAVQEILQKYAELQDIIAILGMDELSDEDRSDGRAAPAKCSASWPSRTHVAEKFTGIPGRVCPAEGHHSRLQGDSVDGEMDDYPESAFFNVGTIEDVKAKAAKEQ